MTKVTTFFILSTLLKALIADRQWIQQINPDCSGTCEKLNLPGANDPSTNNLVYFHSDGSNDTLHFLISTVNGLSALLIQTEKNAQVNVNWQDFVFQTGSSPSITVDGGAVYNSFGFAITKLWRYEDDNDKAQVASASPATAIEAIDMTQILWNASLIDDSSNYSTLIYTSNSTNDPMLLGSVSSLGVSLRVFGSGGHFNVLPQLLHTETSAQFELTLNNLQNMNINNTRYAVELAFVSFQPFTSDNPPTVDHVVSIDDEYTPGTFDTYHISMPESNGYSSYLLWKPVCYTDPTRSLQASTSVSYSTPFVQGPANGLGLIDGFFGINNYKSIAFNVSFGLSLDNFYKGYTVWTMLIGSGEVPVEKFSTLVISLLVVCIAVPAGAFLIGGSYGVYAKFIKEKIIPPKKTDDTLTNDAKKESEDDEDSHEKF